MNESQYKFAVNAKGEIRFGLGAVKGVGEAAVEALVNERKEEGPYISIFDLTKRVDLKAANKKSLESLVYAGAFDSFENANRATYFAEDGTSTFLEKGREIRTSLSAQSELSAGFTFRRG